MQKLRNWSTRIPIRWRLALVSFGLLAILLAALGVLVSFTAEQAMLNNQAISLHDEAQLVLGGIKGRPFKPEPSKASPPPTGTPSPDLTTRAQDLVQRLASVDIRATVLSTDGTVLASSDNLSLPVPPAVTLSPPVIRQQLAEAQQSDSHTLADDSQGQRQLVVVLPLTSTQGSTVLLELSTPTLSIDRSIMTLRLILASGIAGALGIAAALTLPLIAAALHPLVTMERTSRRISSGDLSLRLNVSPTNDEIGRLARSFNSMVSRLEKTFLRQKQFVADVSHELRTPLTALGGSIEMLLLGADRGDVEASRRLMRGMYAEVERMRRLVEDLLVLTRLDEGRITMHMEPIDVSALLQKVCEQAQQLARGQTVRCHTQLHIPALLADPDRLQQVLLNLVDNALKFTPSSGLVEITAREESRKTVLIEVHDTGAGIPAEALPHVFERFYRADPSRVRFLQQVGGSGLGLSIAKEMIEAQGGQITISSKEGEGTTVTIRLHAAPSTTLKPLEVHSEKERGNV